MVAIPFPLNSAPGRVPHQGAGRLINAYWEPLQFELPPSPGADRDVWRRCIDTALPSPDDIQPWEAAPVVRETSYLVQPRSIVLLALALDEGDRQAAAHDEPSSTSGRRAD